MIHAASGERLRVSCLSQRYRTAQRGGSRGFTLIEVLLAMMLVFLVGTAVFQGYRTALDASGRASGALTRIVDERHLAAAIRAEIVAGRHEGETHTRERDWRWTVTGEQRAETVLGYDYELMALRNTGRFVTLYQVQMTDARTGETLELELLER